MSAPLPSFATPAEVSEYLSATSGEALPAEAYAHVQWVLDGLAAGLRADTGQLLTRDTSTATFWPRQAGCELPLPQQPVIDVAEVLLDGVVIADWEHRNGVLWREAGWRGAVTVTWTYGYAEVPADVREFAVMVAAAESAGDGVVSSETVGPFTVRFDTETETGARLAVNRDELVRRYSWGHIATARC